VLHSIRTSKYELNSVLFCGFWHVQLNTAGNAKVASKEEKQ